MEGEFEPKEVNKLKGSGLLYCGQPFRTALIATTKHFTFTHLTVLEFLAARWFVKENCVPDVICSKMFLRFMVGVLSSEGNEELMKKLLDSPFMNTSLKIYCLTECQNKEFAKKFIRNNPQAFCNSDGVMAFFYLSHVDYIRVSFVLDIISELNKEEAGEAQHKCSDKFVPVKKVALHQLEVKLPKIQPLFNSLNNEHYLVSELTLHGGIFGSKCKDVISRLVERKLTTLSLVNLCFTDSLFDSICIALQHPCCKLTTLSLKDCYLHVARLCKALQHPSCKLTTLSLGSDTTDTDVASLCRALQHPSCKLTTLNLGSRITDTGVVSLCKALQHSSCKLTTLSIQHMDITVTGVASLFKALQHSNCKLTTLSLYRRTIPDTCAASLRDALQHPSCKLTTLNLKSRFLPGKAVAILREAIQHPSCKLTTLSMQLPSITDTSVTSLCEALRHSSCKLTLALASSLCDEIQKRLTAITQRHRPALKLSFEKFNF